MTKELNLYPKHDSTFKENLEALIGITGLLLPLIAFLVFIVFLALLMPTRLGGY